MDEDRTPFRSSVRRKRVWLLPLLLLVLIFLGLWLRQANDTTRPLDPDAAGVGGLERAPEGAERR